MKKLFTFIALAMSFMGGYAQGTYKEFTESMVIQTSKDNVQAEADKGWMSGFSALTESQKSSLYNPLTGEKLEKAEKYNSLDLKNGNTKKSLDAYIGNVELLTIYLVNSSTKDVRGLLVTALAEGASEEKNATFLVPVNESYVCEVILDPSEKYKLTFAGVAADGTTGADIYVVGMKFAVPTIKTAASSFSSYSASYAVDYSSLGLDAYAITLDEANMKVKYNKIEGVVPANTPVLVKGEASKTYSLTKAEGDAATVSTDLEVSDGTIEGDGSTIYAFGTKDGVSGFKIVKAGVKIPAKKGYLQLSSSSTGPKDFFAFGGETTGINNISANGIDEEETPLFNLAGQRVNKSYKGVVVKNGKKFVNK